MYVEILPFGTIDSDGSLIHVGLGGDGWEVTDAYGDRNPAIWFLPNSFTLYICSAINGDKNHCITKALLPQKLTTLVIQQQEG